MRPDDREDDDKDDREDDDKDDRGDDDEDDQEDQDGQNGKGYTRQCHDFIKRHSIDAKALESNKIF